MSVLYSADYLLNIFKSSHFNQSKSLTQTVSLKWHQTNKCCVFSIKCRWMRLIVSGRKKTANKASLQIFSQIVRLTNVPEIWNFNRLMNAPLCMYAPHTDTKTSAFSLRNQFDANVFVCFDIKYRLNQNVGRRIDVVVVVCLCSPIYANDQKTFEPILMNHKITNKHIDPSPPPPPHRWICDTCRYPCSLFMYTFETGWCSIN